VTRTTKKPAELLREAGLRRTPVRTGVLDILAQERQPMSAPQILEKLPEGTDNVTLYRTLQTFAGKRLVHRVRGDDQVWRFGLGAGQDATQHEHAHFVCDECGTVECLDDAPAPEEPKKKYKIRNGYRVAYSEVLVHGTCRECHH
jgi:Fur family transcriptional regulator, ferric uptake regulator